MELKAQIQEDMKAALKAGETIKLGALRMLIAEIKKREIDKRAPLDTAEIHKTISSLLKQRQDSIEAFKKGGRQDLVDQETREVEVLSVYLPQQMSRAEVESLVTQAIQETGASSPNDIGKVMKAALGKTQGRADGKLINEIARTKLSGA